MDDQLQVQRPDLSVHAAKKLTPGHTVDDLVVEVDQGLGLRIAEAVVPDIVDLYADRLVEIRLFGSWVRGQASTESDIDVLVVVDEAMKPWDETDFKIDLYGRLIDRHDREVDLTVVSEAKFLARSTSVVRDAVVEGVVLFRRG